MCSTLIEYDHGHEVGLLYVILIWIFNWEMTVQILVDVLNWLLSLVFGGN